MTGSPLEDIRGARALLALGDDITTDHISPVGAIRKSSAAGAYLFGRGEKAFDFNQYSTRRGNHEVMLRGIFSNAKLRNRHLANESLEGGFAVVEPGREILPAYLAAAEYRKRGTPQIIIAGKSYGAGTSRDWAAKGPALLGAGAIIPESFERIHRSNLIGLGVLPLRFDDDHNLSDVILDGS